MSALSPPLTSFGPWFALATSPPSSFVKSAIHTLLPLPAPFLSPPSISSGLFAVAKPGSSTGLLPSVPPVAAGVTRPMSAGLAAPGAPPAPAPTSPRCIQLLLQDMSYIKIECVNCSGPHTATSHTCPFFTHRFNAPALTELQKAHLHRLKEAQASKAALKPARPAKGKAKA
ncbi:hypothetical protein AX15_006056 [Amanita polypyramis BW_CC]|nr:hypothetical protein AX15_006056 [Amanita polypyramis BW_CC]